MSDRDQPPEHRIAEHFPPARRVGGFGSAITSQRVLGGLATDTREPMPEALRTYIQDTWRRIEHSVPGTKFNFEFWSRCRPRRSTYPACRAVIAAIAQGPHFEEPMIEAIQRKRSFNPI